MIDVLQIPDVLDAAACAALRAKLRQLTGSAAPVLGDHGDGPVMPLVRQVTRVAAPPAMAERMTRLLMAHKDALERHFAVVLATCEAPQFLRYQKGDFFVPHQDGNTPLIHDDSRFRRISAVIFLSPQFDAPSPESYGGGVLVLHGPYLGPQLRVPVPAAPGTLVCFRAETTHEVTPVTHGERFTIVSWYR
jgi:SM-20-related protein